MVRAAAARTGRCSGSRLQRRRLARVAVRGSWFERRQVARLAVQGHGSSGGGSHGSLFGGHGSSGGGSSGGYAASYPAGSYAPVTVSPQGQTTYAAPAASDVAYLNVSVPADAKVYLQDQLMTLAGTQRRFVTPQIEAGTQHVYTVKVEVVRNGQTFSKTTQAVVASRAGGRAFRLRLTARTRNWWPRRRARQSLIAPAYGPVVQAGEGCSAVVLSMRGRRMDPSFPRSCVWFLEAWNRGPDVSQPTDQRPAPSEPSLALRGSRGRLLRWAVNGWLVFHISAIIIAPASVSPVLRLGSGGLGVFQPYLDLLFLNHGYHFFAPEPGESTLLAYEAERADGTVVKGRIPNRGIVAATARITGISC